MVDDGDHLKVYLDNIVIHKDERKYTLPLSDLGIIVIDGIKTNITTRLLSVCSQYNVVLVFCDKKHLPAGMYLPFNQHSRTVKAIRKQIRWRTHEKEALWKNIVKYKINNQSQILYHYTGNKEKYFQLQEYMEKVMAGDRTNREGHAAKVYFNTLFGKEFYRGIDCIENAMLNYGYAVIRAYIARSIVGYGYNPGIGIFHKSEYNSFCLADDILEVFRPLVDAYVILQLLDNANMEFLTQEIRSTLVDILSKRILFEGKYRKVSTVINKFTLQCFNILDPDRKGIVKLNNFDIMTGEGLKK